MEKRREEDEGREGGREVREEGGEGAGVEREGMWGDRKERE